MSEHFCPFIGVEEDRFTAVGFPSQRNMCHRDNIPMPVDTIHQGKYCMSAEHTTCPIFLRQAGVVATPPAKAAKAAQAASSKPLRQAQTASLKADTIPLKSPKHRARTIVPPLMAVVGAVAIFLAVLLILPPSGAFQGMPPVAMTDTLSPLLPSLTSTSSSLGLLLRVSLTPTSLFSPTPPSTATGNPTLTATKRTSTSTPAPVVFVPTQCIPPAGWVLYIVRAGDTLSNLSRIFNISIAQLQSANCMGSSVTLYVGQSIYTPWIPATQIIPTQIIPTQIPPSPVPPSATVSTNTPVPTTAVPTTAVPTTAVPSLTATVVPPTQVPTEETINATIGAPPVSPTESPVPPTEEGG